jgi:hypothetical protein
VKLLKLWNVALKLLMVAAFVLLLNTSLVANEIFWLQLDKLFNNKKAILAS